MTSMLSTTADSTDNQHTYVLGDVLHYNGHDNGDPHGCGLAEAGDEARVSRGQVDGVGDP